MAAQISGLIYLRQFKIYCLKLRVLMGNVMIHSVIPSFICPLNKHGLSMPGLVGDPVDTAPNEGVKIPGLGEVTFP